MFSKNFRLKIKKKEAFMKKLSFTLFSAIVLVAISTPVSAEVDHWATLEECKAATTAPYYYPTILYDQKIDVKKEFAQGRTTPLCIEMDLPDRLGGKGWVRVGDDREIFYDKKTGEPLRLEKCNNHIYEIVALPAQKGEKGDKGDVVYTPMPMLWASPPPPVDDRWFCARHPVVCTVGGILIGGAIIYVATHRHHNGGGSTPPGGNTGGGTPGGTTGDGTPGGPSGPNSF